MLMMFLKRELLKCIDLIAEGYVSLLFYKEPRVKSKYIPS